MIKEILRAAYFKEKNENIASRLHSVMDEVLRNSVVKEAVNFMASETFNYCNDSIVFRLRKMENMAFLSRINRIAMKDIELYKYGIAFWNLERLEQEIIDRSELIFGCKNPPNAAWDHLASQIYSQNILALPNCNDCLEIAENCISAVNKKVIENTIVKKIQKDTIENNGQNVIKFLSTWEPWVAHLKKHPDFEDFFYRFTKCSKESVEDMKLHAELKGWTPDEKLSMLDYLSRSQLELLDKMLEKFTAELAPELQRNIDKNIFSSSSEKVLFKNMELFMQSLKFEFEEKFQEISTKVLDCRSHLSQHEGHLPEHARILTKHENLIDAIMPTLEEIYAKVELMNNAKEEITIPSDVPPQPDVQEYYVAFVRSMEALYRMSQMLTSGTLKLSEPSIASAAKTAASFFPVPLLSGAVSMAAGVYTRLNNTKTENRGTRLQALFADESQFMLVAREVAKIICNDPNYQASLIIIASESEGKKVGRASIAVCSVKNTLRNHNLMPEQIANTHLKSKAQSDVKKLGEHIGKARNTIALTQAAQQLHVGNVLPMVNWMAQILCSIPLGDEREICSDNLSTDLSMSEQYRTSLISSSKMHTRENPHFLGLVGRLQSEGYTEPSASNASTPMSNRFRSIKYESADREKVIDAAYQLHQRRESKDQQKTITSLQHQLNILKGYSDRL